jgi:hypothetical protein
MPSLLGPTNLPPLQALELGTPAIVSDAHAFDDVAQGMMTVVPALASDAWARALISSLGAPRPKAFHRDHELTVFRLENLFARFDAIRALW